MKRSDKIIAAIVIIVIAAAAVLLVLKIGNIFTPGEKESAKIGDEAKKLMERDLGEDYPQEPTEVVSLFSDILKYYYNGKCSDEEAEELAMYSRQLISAELLNINAKEEHLKSLKEEIDNYNNSKRVIMDYSMTEKDKVIYSTEGTEERAMLQVTYNLREGKTFSSTAETFVLVKDGSGKWKIYGWKISA